MNPFQKILVPIDFAIPAHHAMQVAADVSRRYEAPITVLHVCEPDRFAVPSSYEPLDPARVPRILEVYSMLLEDVRHELRAAGVMQVDTALAQGEPFREIIDFARAGDFDLIVIGTHGRSGFGHALLGSVTERVVQKAPCAVLTARLDPPTSSPSIHNERAGA